MIKAELKKITSVEPTDLRPCNQCNEIIYSEMHVVKTQLYVMNEPVGGVISKKYYCSSCIKQINDNEPHATT